jgi:cobalt transporter subunit CbtB
MTDRPATAAIAESGARAVPRPVQIALALLLGALAVGTAGFAPIELAHNAAHDYRHSMGFPCH